MDLAISKTIVNWNEILLSVSKIITTLNITLELLWNVLKSIKIFFKDVLKNP